MQVTIEPTPEIFNAPINGIIVPVRVWRGQTAGGVNVDVYVLSIVPDDGQVEAFKHEIPRYMQPTRDVMKINLTNE